MVEPWYEIKSPLSGNSRPRPGLSVRRNDTTSKLIGFSPGVGAQSMGSGPPGMSGWMRWGGSSGILPAFGPVQQSL